MFDESSYPADLTFENQARARFAEYEAAVCVAEEHYRQGRYDATAAYAGVAALTAMRPHAGLFASPRLERMLLDIGRRTATPTAWRRTSGRPIRNVLHVASEILPVGGLTNNLAHWLQADTGRTHSLALINQRLTIPTNIVSAIAASGGAVHHINRTAGYQIAWASRLRELSQGYDAVVLHTYGQDPVPIIAFAEADKRPPVMLLNHADHLFWLGASIADVVLHMREAALDLSCARRNVARERSVVLPTVVSPPARTRTRAQAKKELGIAEDTVLLFSAARGLKYNTVGGVTFTAPHVQLLKKYPKAQLIVLGAGERPDWDADKAAVNGRIRSLPPTPDTRVYFEAADIYVDSFPFVSSTSMMEAAGLGVPLVSRFYGEKDARIFAINHPGIDKPTLHAATEAEYLAHLDRLIADPELRNAKGYEARLSVLAHHTAPGWLEHLEAAYRLAETIEPIDSARTFADGSTDTFSHGEPDRSLYEVFGDSNETPVMLLRGVTGLLPIGERVKAWRRLHEARGFHGAKDAVRLLLPTWLVRRLFPR